jgi:hypothetical protein
MDLFSFYDSLAILLDLDMHFMPCRKLIADARSAFKSEVPESLKKKLIERLKSFSQEKVQFDGP